MVSEELKMKLASRSSVGRASLLAVVALLVLSTTAPGIAQVESVRTADTFTDEVTVFEVEVPVQVFRNGEPVRGLAASDFVVRYRGEVRDIVSFAVADLRVERSQSEGSGADGETSGAEPMPAATPASTGVPLSVAPEFARSILLLFDFEYQSRGLIGRSVTSAREMVTGSLHPSDRVAVAALGGRNGARMYTGFTTNRERTLLGLDLVDAVADAKGRLQKQIVADLRATAPSTTEGLAAEYGATATVAFGDGLDAVGVFSPNVSAQGEIAGARAFDSGARQDPGVADIFGIGETLGSFNDYRDAAEYAEALGNLGTLLSGVDGQRLAVLFSQGPPLGLLNQGAGPGTIEGASMVANAMERAFGQLVRAGWQIHALGQGQSQAAGFNDGLGIDYDISVSQMSIDAAPGSTGPSGVIAPNFSDGGNTLWYMAKGTGGKAYLNATLPAVDQFVETTSVTYLLRFLLPGVKPSAARERFSVSLSDTQSPAQLQYRPFFYAPKPRADMNSVELAIADADEQIRRRSQQASTRIEFAAHVFADVTDPETVWLSVHLPAAQLRAGSNVAGSSNVVRLAVVAGVEKGGPAGEVALDQTLSLTTESIATPPEDGLTFVGRLDLSVEDVATAVDVRVAVELGPAGAAMKVPLQRWTNFERFDTGVVGPFFLPPGLERLIVRGGDRDGEPVELPLKAPGGVELVPLPFAEVSQGEELGVMLWTKAGSAGVSGQTAPESTIAVRAEPFQAPGGIGKELLLERRGDIGEVTLWFAPLDTAGLNPGVYRIVGVDFDNPGVGFLRVKPVGR